MLVDEEKVEFSSFAHFLDVLFEPEDAASEDTPVASNVAEAKPKDSTVEDAKGVVATVEPGIVAKGTAVAEQGIKRNEQRAKNEEVIVRLRQELRDETESVLRIQNLVDRLKAAEAALEALDVLLAVATFGTTPSVITPLRRHTPRTVVLGPVVGVVLMVNNHGVPHDG